MNFKVHRNIIIATVIETACGFFRIKGVLKCPMFMLKCYVCDVIFMSMFFFSRLPFYG